MTPPPGRDDRDDVRDENPDEPRRTEDPRVVRTRHDVLGAALQVMVDEGAESVTHPNLARVTGYSRATIYNHWPSRHDLLRGAFDRIPEVDHVRPTGDVRADLVAELLRLRSAMQQHGLDRALAVLVDLTAADPELAEIRERLVADTERVVRALLEPRLTPTELEAAVAMLCGAVLHAAMLQGRSPSDEVVAAAVDLVLS